MLRLNQNEFLFLKVEPTFRMNDQFTVENLQYVMVQDSLESSRPINIQVNTPEEISAMFDSISYEKGLILFQLIINFFDISVNI